MSSGHLRKSRYLLVHGLALLLAKKQGDVVATSFRVIGSGLVFYWAKNNNLSVRSQYTGFWTYSLLIAGHL